MPTTLNLIAIPNGVLDDGLLSVSIVVAPRLTDGRRLGHFADMLGWTESLAASSPRILLRFGAAIAEARADLSPLRPDLWTELFNEATPVEPFEFEDASNDLVVSYRTRDAFALVKDAYQKAIAASPGALPEAEASARQLYGFALPQGDNLSALLAEQRMRRWRQQQRQERGHDADVTPPIQETVRDFTLFYRMPQPDARAPDPIPRTDDELFKLFDFHCAITALSAHPSLMRALGLVIDVTVKAPEVAAAGALGFPLAALSVEDFRLVDEFRDVAFMMPRVLYRHHPVAAGLKPVFAAAEPTTNGDVAEGFLGLDERRFHLLDLDVDGAMAKLTALATTLPRSFQSPTKDGALPALRAAGLSLAVHDRGRETVDDLRRAAQINAAITAPPGGASAPLTARDLVRGYRVDVWSSKTQRWRSLHHRQAAYTFGAAGAVKLDVQEEGFAQFASASPAPDPTRPVQPGPPIETDRYVHEALARWTGWSLSVPRPEKPIHRSDTHDALKDDDTADALVTAFRMRQSFAPVVGTLPRLRFGDRYRMRVRIVDVAGNSPAPTELEAAPVAATDYPVALPPKPESQPYFRYEPVPHPLLVLRSLPASGRPALDRIIIRSFNTDPSLDAIETTEMDERHIAPPRTVVDLVERHGMLDDASGALKGDATTFAMIVARNDAALKTAAIGTPPHDVPIEAADRLPVDYLPDPLARSAALRFLPGVAPGRVLFAGSAAIVERKVDPDAEAGPVVQVHFGDAWPDRQAFRLQIVDGDAPPAWDPNSRVLTASVPKATTAEVRLSSGLADADLELMGVWAWQRDYLDERARALIASAGAALAGSLEDHARLSAELLRLALEGGQWALTPSIPLYLIHAVQQPIGRPAFTCGGAVRTLLTTRGALSRVGRGISLDARLVATRTYGSPDATLIGELDAHLRSTGRVDLIASWADITDDKNAPAGFTQSQTQASLEPIKVDRMSGAIPAEGADSRDVAAVVNEQRLAFLPEAAPTQRFGDTRHRRVTYRAISTSRFASDFPEGLVFTRESDPIVVSVPNSAKPPAPRIVQVLPTFGWRRERSGTLTSSIRYGRGLRVYLERPWFVSGEGELLGVVVWPSDTPPPGKETRRDHLAGLVTEWGLDPLRRSGRLPLMPSLADLTGAEHSLTEVAVPEAAIQADVVGYPVHNEGEHWYADVFLAAEEAYMPFVRLALVRLQPDSIPGAEISAVTSAGFMQITPDRSAVLIADPSLPRLYKLVVSGVGPTESTLAPWRNTVEVSIEERQDDIESDLGWQPVSSAMAQVTPTTSSSSAPAILYSGMIEFAAQPVPGRYRIVIREYETWQVDPLPLIRSNFELVHPNVATTVAAKVVQTAVPNVQMANLSVTQPAAPAQSGAKREQAFLLTARAFERLGLAIVGPPVGRRLVYAEFLSVDPPTPAQDLSRVVAGADGEVIGAPGDDFMDGEPDDPPRPWPSQPATSPVGFAPQWDAMPPVGPAMSPTEVSGALKLAQAMLNAATGVQPPLAIDGLFGPLTEAAIRGLRATMLLPDDGGLDSQAWLALATAAPFATLEQGRRSPPMSGPPIALVQRLLNMSSPAPTLTEDGVYTADTSAAVSAFQGDRALPQTGNVDLSTWLELASLFDMVQPAGAERVELGFDRARAADGGPALVLLQRDALENTVVPPSDPLDESWVGRSGLWLEMQDSRSQPLFRLRLGQELTRSPEAPPSAESGDLIGRPGPAIDTTTLSFTLPIIAGVRRLVVMGTIDPDDHGPAGVINVFEPW